MKFLRLDISNWGRFRYPVIVSFDTTPEKNIILIHALNDRGKTSLFYALRWLLYGDKGLRGHPNPTYKKISTWPNMFSAKEGEGDIIIELKLELDDSQIIRIQRKRKFYQTPTGDEIQLSPKDELTIFDDSGPIDVGTNIQNKEDWIQANVLPFDASQFFLFDGEVIQGYMEQPGPSVRRAIEQVLGLKELKNAEEDLNTLSESIQKEITKKSRLNTKDENMKNEIDKLEIDINYVTEFLRGINASKNGAEATVKDCSNKLNKNREIQEKNKKKEDLLQLVKDDKKTLIALNEKLKDKRDYAGLLLINPLLNIILTTEETPPSRQQWESKAAAHMVDGKFENCVCETKIDSNVSQILENKILDLKDNPFSQLKRIVENTSAGYRPDAKNVEINNIVNEISDADARISSNASAAKTISDEILSSGGIGEEVKDLERKQQLAIKEIGKCEKDIDDNTKNLEKLKNKLTNCVNIISQTTADKELAEVIKLDKYVTKVREVFQDAFQKYFIYRKPELEKHISQVFKKLTNNPEMYKGIILENDFSIQILRQDGTLLPSHRYSPSAGAAQIAATAMIGGFNKFTTRKAPVFIDTPLARLDPIHKENLLNYYAEISEQVVILPQPDEIDRKDEEIISDFIAQRYEIIDKSGEPETSIISRRAD